MGTWGTAIKNSDAFADIYNEFFEFYNKGGQPSIISKQIIEDNWEMLDIEEDKHSFWFALALAQWETKSLESKVLQTVVDIVNSGADIKLWTDLGAEEKNIAKRKVVLCKFLEKLHSEKPKAKARKNPKLKTPIFSTGDCLVFKLKNGHYGGAVVLAADSNPETANNLVATTRINQQNKPSITDFEKSKVLILNYANWNDKIDVCWYMPDLYFKKYAGNYENIGKIDIDLVYETTNYSGEGYLFKPSWTGAWKMNENANRQFESEFTKPKPSNSITIRQLTKKHKSWKIL